jgi:hypothetical protein
MYLISQILGNALPIATELSVILLPQVEGVQKESINTGVILENNCGKDVCPLCPLRIPVPVKYTVGIFDIIFICSQCSATRFITRQIFYK